VDDSGDGSLDGWYGQDPLQLRPPRPQPGAELPRKVNPPRMQRSPQRATQRSPPKANGSTHLKPHPLATTCPFCPMGGSGRSPRSRDGRGLRAGVGAVSARGIIEVSQREGDTG
jgi:hypothetical protein